MDPLKGNWHIYSLEVTPTAGNIKYRQVNILNNKGTFDLASPSETVTFRNTGRTEHGKPYYEGSSSTLSGNLIGVQILESNSLLFGHVSTKTGTPLWCRCVFFGLLNPRKDWDSRTFNVPIRYRFPNALYNTGTIDIDRPGKTLRLNGTAFTIDKDQKPITYGGVHLVATKTAPDEKLEAWILADSNNRALYIGYHWKRYDFSPLVPGEVLGPPGSQYCTRPIIGNVSWT